MEATYQKFIVTRHGGPEVLTLTHASLREPRAGEVRVKVSAAGVSWTDSMMRHGVYPGQPKLPFTPGYDIVGTVDRVGAGCTHLIAGQTVAALITHGGYAEYVYVAEDQLVPLPEGLEPAEAVSLVLNYVTAYQMLHRIVQSDKVLRILVHNGAGGVGTALLDLARYSGQSVVASASREKHALLSKLSAKPIDFNNHKAVKRLCSLRGNQFDLILDSIGGRHWLQSFACLRKGGTLIGYGTQSSIVNGRPSVAKNIETYACAASLYLRPGSRKFAFYSITGLRRKNPELFRTDLTTLATLLQTRKIKPVVAERIAWTNAVHANQLLEQRKAQGKLVLMF